MKRIRRPLTDVNGRDFLTGKLVETPILEQEKNINKRIEKWIKQKIKESAVDGKIYVEWLGYVKI